MRNWALAAAAAMAAMAGAGAGTSAQAHPHVWIDAAIHAFLDEAGQITAVEITWTYDEFYTLMILEERGLDPDGDGALTAAETASLQGFDMKWQEGYPGDSYALLGDAALVLGPPVDFTARVEGGFITSTHVRHLEHPLRPAAEVPLIVQSYEPEYYIDYTIIAAGFKGADDGCSAVIHGYDTIEADAIWAAASQEYMDSTDPDMPFPKIGAAFSDEVRFACPAR